MRRKLQALGMTVYFLLVAAVALVGVAAVSGDLEGYLLAASFEECPGGCEPPTTRVAAELPSKWRYL
jgi:hypothetical protein